MKRAEFFGFRPSVGGHLWLSAVAERDSRGSSRLGSRRLRRLLSLTEDRSPCLPNWSADKCSVGICMVRLVSSTEQIPGTHSFYLVERFERHGVLCAGDSTASRPIRVEKTPLFQLGYRAGVKSTLTSARRRKLRYALAADLDRDLDLRQRSEGAADRWGQPRSWERFAALLETLAHCVKRTQRSDQADAHRHYVADLEYLVNELGEPSWRRSAKSHYAGVFTRLTA